MRVLRVECRGCPKPHGPLQSHQMTYDEEVEKGWTYISYGGRLETPQSDPLLNFTIAAFEQCGTLPDMFDRWWSAGVRAYEELPEPWRVVVYEASKARVGRNQVLFDRDNSTELLVTYFVQSALDFARENEMYGEQPRTVYPVSNDIRTRNVEVAIVELTDIYELQNNNFNELIFDFYYYDREGRKVSKKVRIPVDNIG